MASIGGHTPRGQILDEIARFRAELEQTDAPKPPDVPTLVVAGNYREYLDWCRRREINPRDRRFALWVENVTDLYGRRGCRFTTTGTYNQRREWREIVDTAEACGLVRV